MDIQQATKDRDAACRDIRISRANAFEKVLKIMYICYFVDHGIFIMCAIRFLFHDLNREDTALFVILFAIDVLIESAIDKYQEHYASTSIEFISLTLMIFFLLTSCIGCLNYLIVSVVIHTPLYRNIILGILFLYIAVRDIYVVQLTFTQVLKPYPSQLRIKG